MQLHLYSCIAQLRIMTFMARDQTMWRLLMDPGQDPFAQLAAQWHGLPQSQVLVLLLCGRYVGCISWRRPRATS